MTIRPLALSELARVTRIDVAESGSSVYSVVEGQLVAFARAWQRPRRSAERWQPYIAEWGAMLERGGAAIGAFADERLVGIAVVRDQLTDTMAQLAALFVDRAHRRQGIATALLHEVMPRARAGGAQALYVSATPSESAVGFYLSQGFTLATLVNDQLYEREPEDIHMVRAL